MVVTPEPWELEAAAVFMDHVDDDDTGSVHRVAAFLRSVAAQQGGDALSAVADYLELRDESVGPDEADEAERQESAREILSIVAVHQRILEKRDAPIPPPHCGRAIPITADEAADREAQGLHVEWAEGVGHHYFPESSPS